LDAASSAASAASSILLLTSFKLLKKTMLKQRGKKTASFGEKVGRYIAAWSPRFLSTYLRFFYICTAEI
jgi:hypothetical protein